MITRRALVLSAFAGCSVALSCSQPESDESPMAQANKPAMDIPPEPRPLDVEALKKRLDAGEDVFLLDVREPAELEGNRNDRGLREHSDGPARGSDGGDPQGPSGCTLLKPRRTGLPCGGLAQGKRLQRSPIRGRGRPGKKRAIRWCTRRRLKNRDGLRARLASRSPTYGISRPVISQGLQRVGLLPGAFFLQGRERFA